MNGSKSKPDVVILHLSDLHFGSYLQGVSRAGGWESVCAPHSFNILQGMETEIYRIFKKYKDNLIIALTGDLTTAAEPPAYEAVNNYLRDEPFVSDRARVGLKLDKMRDRLFVVPGNHDIWLYGNIWHRRLRYVNRNEQYRKYFSNILPNAYTLIINGIPITLFTLDTNRHELPILNIRNVLGRGKVGKQQLGDLQTIHNRLKDGTFQGIPPDFDYDASLKIALMHHHLKLPSNIPPDPKQDILKLEDADDVFRVLSDINVKMVLCGHQHFPFIIPPEGANGIFLSCAGSATQLDCSVNSFFVYEISKNHGDTYSLSVSRHEKAADGFFFKEKPSQAFTI